MQASPDETYSHLPSEKSLLQSAASPADTELGALVAISQLDDKISALQLLSQSAAADGEAAAAPTPLTINIQIDTSSNVYYYYSAPDMTLHPMLHNLGLSHPMICPTHFQPQYPLLQPLQPSALQLYMSLTIARIVPFDP